MRSPELLFTSRTILLLASQCSQSEFERVQEVACKSQEGAQTWLSRVTIATTHRQQLVEDARVHRRHVETSPTHTAFSHRPQLTHAPLKNKSAYGAPSKCSLERFQHVLQLSLHRWHDKNQADNHYCVSWRCVAHLRRQPAIHSPPPIEAPRRSNICSYGLTSRVRTLLAPPGVLNRASELFADADFAVISPALIIKTETGTKAAVRLKGDFWLNFCSEFQWSFCGSS